jgi:outer membrane biosynthesis protein TonB
MRKRLLLVGLVGCWSSSTKPATRPAPLASPEKSASTGGATYGGATYGVHGTSLGAMVAPLANPNGGGGGAPPTVLLGAPGGSSEALDPAIIRRYIRRNIDKIQLCYEQELPGDPKLAGKVTVRFTIGADGKVIQASAAGMPPVDACVAAVISTIEFPPPRGGGIVNVNYPFIFQQADPGPPPAP